MTLRNSILLTALFSMCTNVASAGPVVLPPNLTVAGKTIGQWSVNWWQWALSFSAPNDPFTDTTGANANLGQSGPVFFLAANPNVPSTRNFNAPAGAYLLVPLLVGELSQLEIGFDKSAADVRQAAKELADQIDSLTAVIDGVAVPNLFTYRVTSPDFQFVAAPDNPIGVPTGNSGIAVADGYFLMLAPLSAGTHTIQFGGGISAFQYLVLDTDVINAVPEPSTFALFVAGLIVVGRALARAEVHFRKR